ncbi:putative ATPase [Methylophaga frappieri]|uniref:Putative ATPase n=1 Tax=Methylophaga frappieri (strain ATCC BAA-2434 / DSM 25690 / JAM7) TaxID=754477 RepID=I1YF04_METFJ|nr:ATP-binding protein [Methylophaga frappieri]AFJ01497.1 putative ATPase [Methylophaga frappieri]
MSKSVSIKSELLIDLIKDGLSGNIDSLGMRVRRIASSLRSKDPDFVSHLNQLIGSDTALRGVTREKGPVPVDSDTRQHLVSEIYPVILTINPFWDEHVSYDLDLFIREREGAEKLMEQGLLPSRSMLLEGPPGVGKTLAAKWLAQSLDLPLLTLDLATVMSSFLGKTGNNIRAVLNYAMSFPCVLLLDEFDSIAKKRDDDTDVGELKRLVTVLLQSIDDWPSTSILIAATNHGELLDPAVWRRFDKVIRFDIPDARNIREFIRMKGVHESLASILSLAVVGSSFANIEKRLAYARKSSILNQTPYSVELLKEFKVRETHVSHDEHLTRDFQVINLTGQGVSQRKISEALGVSRGFIKTLITKVEQGSSL